jgi:hypothetical protein
LLAPAVFQTTRVETETEIAKWPGKPRDLDEYQVIPEVRTYVFFSQMFFLSFFLDDICFLDKDDNGP